MPVADARGLDHGLGHRLARHGVRAEGPEADDRDGGARGERPLRHEVRVDPVRGQGVGPRAAHRSSSSNTTATLPQRPLAMSA